MEEDGLLLPSLVVICSLHLVQQLFVVSSIDCVSLVRKLNEQIASLAKINKYFPANSRVLAFNMAASPFLCYSRLTCFDSDL